MTMRMRLPAHIYLSSLGHDVETAYSGEEALQKLRCRLRILCCWISNARMNGLELTRRLRMLPVASQTYIAAVTGWGKPEDELRSKEAGIDQHLVKPVEPAQLNAILELPALRSKDK